MKVVALAGGVGGAKLVFGLDRILQPGDLTVIVNTGDDFEHYGLFISPDIDTVCYHLAELNDPETGWGRIKDSFVSLNEAIKLGGPPWFKIGDRDLGIHIERTRRLKNGQKLSEITKIFCRIWKINSNIYPMSDEKVSTILSTKKNGDLPFQEYFVHLKCIPEISAIRFEGAEMAQAVPEAIHAIRDADLVIICPSNPFVSIDPILSINEISKSLYKKKIIAVSPIIQGKALKGPAAKMFTELGVESSALSVLRHYQEIIQGFVFDRLDLVREREFEREGIIFFATNTIMQNHRIEINLAKEILDFSMSIPG